MKRCVTWRHWEQARSWSTCPVRAVLTRPRLNVTIGDMGTEIRFAARDGASLVGTLFEADEPRGAVLIGCATGVLQRFYEPFARWLAEERKLTTLTFDYRGIGRSLSGKLADCEATKLEWGQKDLPAALDALAEHVPNLPLYLVGNSGGGQLVGVMDNALKLSRIVMIGSSSGHLKHLAPRLRIPAQVLMKLWMPVSNRLFGYSKAKAIGWGEDLPRHVAEQWTYWCSGPGYVENDFGSAITEHHYFDIKAPILNLAFVDDPIATEHNVDDLMRLFTSAVIVKKRVAPSDFGLKEVGHVGFFRRASRAIWPLVGDFLDAEDVGAQSVSSREPSRGSAQSR